MPDLEVPHPHPPRDAWRPRIRIPGYSPQVQAGVPPESSTCRGTVLTFLLDGEVVCQVLHRQLPIRNAAIPLWTSMSSYRCAQTQAPNLQGLGLCSGERQFTWQLAWPAGPRSVPCPFLILSSPPYHHWPRFPSPASVRAPSYTAWLPSCSG